MSDIVTRMQLPENALAIVSDDGRVFYDMSELWKSLDSATILREKAARITGDGEDIAYVAGERSVLDHIKNETEVLSYRAMLDSLNS